MNLKEIKYKLLGNIILIIWLLNVEIHLFGTTLNILDLYTNNLKKN